MYLFFKRIFDILASLLAIAVLLPFMIPIIIALLLTGEHCVFYFQERIGKGGRSFKIWKFATMLKNSPNMGTGTITVRDDPRVLPMGRFLRKTKINELPQLMNILLGDMSVIGPRPLVPHEYENYTDEVKKVFCGLKPGLSGIGSIIFRDEERYTSQASDPVLFNKEVMQHRKGDLERWYASHRSLWVDFMLIVLTVWVVLFPESDAVHRVFKDLPPMDLQRDVDDFNRRTSSAS